MKHTQGSSRSRQQLHYHAEQICGMKRALCDIIEEWTDVLSANMIQYLLRRARAVVQVDTAVITLKWLIALVSIKSLFIGFRLSTRL